MPLNLAKSAEHDSEFVFPTPDYGRAHAFQQGLKSGYDTSLTGMTVRGLKYWGLRTKAANEAFYSGGMQEDFIDEAQFKDSFSLNGALKFDGHYNGRMSREYAQVLRDDFLDDRFNEAQAGFSSKHAVSNLAGGLIASVASPLDLAINVAIPVGTPVRLGFGATVAARAGSGVGRAISRTANGAINGGAQGILQQPVMMAMAAANQTPYTMEDVVANVALAPLMGMLGGGLQGVVSHASGEWDRIFANAVLADPTMAGKMAASDPRVRAEIDFRTKVKETVTAANPEAAPKDGSDLLFMSEPFPEKLSDIPLEDQMRAGPNDAADIAAGATETAQTMRSMRDPAIKPKRLIAEILEDPNDTRIGGAVTDDEKFLSEAWRTMFGIDLRFIDPDLARTTGVTGFVRGTDPSKAYIRRGALNDRSPDSMIFLAGHELGHTVRLRDPAMWKTMVDAIMKTAKEDGGELDRAWLLNAQQSRGSLAWAELNLAGRMDEAFATVLGRSMQNKNFWVSLGKSAPESAGQLVTMLRRSVQRLEGLLFKRSNDQIRTLHDELSKALMAADPSGQLLKDKSTAAGWWQRNGTGPEALAKYYAHWGTDIRGFTKRMATFMNEVGSESDKEMARFVEWADRITPQVGQLSDRSATPMNPGRFASVLPKKKINSNNPGLWLITGVWKRLAATDPTSEEAQLFRKWVAGIQNPGTGFSPDKPPLPTQKKLGKQDRAASAIREYSPLAEFKRNADGSWDIGLYRNDDFPRWTEFAEAALDRSDDGEFIARGYFEENVTDKIRKEFLDYVSRWKDPADTPPEILEFIDSMGQTLVDRHLLSGDVAVLWDEFASWLDLKMSASLLHNFPDRYKTLGELRTRVGQMADGKAKDTVIKEGPNGQKTEVPDDSALMGLEASWAKMIKEYPAIKKTMDEEFLSDKTSLGLPLAWDQASLPPKEYFAQLMTELRMDVENDLNEFLHVMQKLREMPEGDEAINYKGRDFFKVDLPHHEKTVKAHVEAEALSRLYALWPNADRLVKISELTKLSAEDRLIVNGRQAELAPIFQEAGERFNRDSQAPNPFTDLSEQFSFMSGPQDLRAHVAANEARAREAVRLTKARLDREHAAWSPFAKDPVTHVGKANDARLKDLGLESWKLEDTGAPMAAGAAPIPKDHPALKKLDGVKQRFQNDTTQLDEILNGNVGPDSPAHLIASLDHYKRKGFSTQESGPLVYEDLFKQGQADVAAVLTDHRAKTTLLGRARQSLDTLYSYLDGSPRKDVLAAGQSIAEDISGRSVADASPFLQDLHFTGLDQRWLQNDEDLMRGFMRYMTGGGTDDPLLKQLADTLRRTNEIQVGRLNSLGARIDLLDDFAFSQVHNALAIARLGPEGWKNRIRDWVDWDRMERLHGKIKDKEAFLDAVFREVGDPKKPLPDMFDEVTMGGNLAAQLSHRRVIHFKDTFGFDYDMEFGSGNTGGHIVSTIQRRAEMAVAMEHVGSNPKKNWAEVMYELGRPGAWRFEKLGRIDGTMQELLGNLNHPDDVRLAAIGRASRQYIDMVATWMAGVSSITDFGNATSALKWMGAEPKELETDLGSLMKDYMSQGPQERAILLGQGAGLEALLAAFSRTQMVRGKLFRLGEAGADFTYKYNGQQVWSNTLQTAFHDLASQHLGSFAGRNAPESLLNWLGHYGISTEEWGRMGSFAREMEGFEGKRLVPDLIEDEALSAKLRVALMDTMHQAVLQPSVSNRAVLTFYTKAGTPLGEAVRTLNKYKGYPLAMMTRIHRRFANAYGNEQMSMFGISVNQGRIAQLSWGVSMLSLATTVLAIKDILRGREPFNPFDSEQWTLGNASRIVTQAGVGPFAVAEQFLSGHHLLGPGFGIATNLAEAAGSGNTYQRANALLGAVPGSSIIPLKEGFKATLGAILPEAYGVHYQTFLRRDAAERGQSSIFLDNERQP